MGLLRFLWCLFLTNGRSVLAMRAAAWMQAGLMVLNNLVFFIFWWVFFRQVPEVRGWTLTDVEALFGITATSFGLVVAMTGGVRHLARLIEEGELDTLLVQPKPTLVYALGMRSSPSGVGDIASGLFLLALSGLLRPATVPVAALAIVLAAATALASGIVFFSLPFWMGRTESLARQLWEIVATFALYPEPLFGGAVRLLLFTLLPAGLIGYLPLTLVRQPSWAGVATLTVGAGVYLAAAVWIFSRGLRRYVSGSRFVVHG